MDMPVISKRVLYLGPRTHHPIVMQISFAPDQPQQVEVVAKIFCHQVGADKQHVRSNGIVRFFEFTIQGHNSTQRS
jgi:hypothetical protein